MKDQKRMLIPDNSWDAGIMESWLEDMARWTTYPEDWPDMAQAGQAAGVYAVIASAQQSGDGNAPDMFHIFLFEEQKAPDAMFNIEPAAGDGQVNMRMLSELAAIGVQGAENVNFDAHFAGKTEHSPGRAAKQVVEQRPVIVEKRPEHMGHGKGDVLPVAVGQDVLLCRNPLFGGLEAATAAGF